MRQLITLIILLTFISCNSKSEKKSNVEQEEKEIVEQYHIKIDSTFLFNYDTKGLNIFPKPKSFTIEENESVYELVKKKIIFYEYSDFLVEKVKCKILVTGFPQDFKLDSDLRFVYLATTDLNNNLIDFKQIGIYDWVSDIYFIVTSEITGNNLIRNSYYEYFGGKSTIKNYKENFKIDRTGKIIKLTNN